jgi:predicted enzyme related to lactoylglutathione lyase
VLVPDQEEAIPFFTETLGLVKCDDYRMPDGSRWVSVAPEPAAFPRLAVVDAATDHPRLPSVDANTRRERVGSQVGEYVAFVFSVEDCRDVVETLSDRGVAVVAEPNETPWGVEASFRDPWGNVYEVVEPA